MPERPSPQPSPSLAPVEGAADAPPGGWPAGPPPLRLVSTGPAATALLPGSAGQARTQFERFNAIHFDGLLEPALFTLALQLARGSDFEIFQNETAAQELEASPQRAGRVLNLALSRDPFLRWLEEVTGSGPLARIEGRIMQTRLRPGDQLHWHDDLVPGEGRRLALVINLADTPFTGGEFQMHEKSGQPLFEHRYTTPGDALLFRIGPGLEHCVRPLTGGGPRRVFAGWAFGKLPA